MDSNSQYQSSGGTTDIVSETDDTADIVKGSSDKRYIIIPTVTGKISSGHMRQ